MDPVGFSLENYDAVGTWRTEDSGAPIDASGKLADGSAVNGVVSVRNAILARPEIFAGAVTEKLVIYALGRGVEYQDMPLIRSIVRDASRNNNRFSSLILGIVKSQPFNMNVKESETVASSK